MDEDTEQPAGDSSSQQPERLRATLLASPEGRILLIGAALAFAYIFWLGVKLLLSPDEFQVLTGMTAMNIMFNSCSYRLSVVRV
ncbi:MAG: hypothetical protein ACYTGS_20505 [Planctomycetota bacterium]|jgi:hypothetical protein